MNLAWRRVVCYLYIPDFSMLHDRDYMRDSGRHAWSETLWPDAVTLLIIVNAVVFVAQHFFGIGADHLSGRRRSFPGGNCPLGR